MLWLGFRRERPNGSRTGLEKKTGHGALGGEGICGMENLQKVSTPPIQYRITAKLKRRMRRGRAWHREQTQQNKGKSIAPVRFSLLGLSSCTIAVPQLAQGELSRRVDKI
jgi:hypothetical protein